MILVTALRIRTPGGRGGGGWVVCRLKSLHYHIPILYSTTYTYLKQLIVPLPYSGTPKMSQKSEECFLRIGYYLAHSLKPSYIMSEVFSLVSLLTQVCINISSVIDIITKRIAIFTVFSSAIKLPHTLFQMVDCL